MPNEATRIEQHVFTENDEGLCAECGLVRIAARHAVAVAEPRTAPSPGRTPLRLDAGEPSRESNPTRSAFWKRTLVYDLIETGARSGVPVCDADVWIASGLKWNESTAIRNALCVAREVVPIPDASGKRNPLKVLVGERLVTVSEGPWRAKDNPRGRGRVIVWVPAVGPYGGYRHESETEHPHG